jgi:hypothetical protein
MKRLPVLLALIILPACTTVTTETAGVSPLTASLDDVFVKDLRGADFNAQNYIKIGKLKSGDPVAGCVRDAMVEFGLDNVATDGASFQPKHDGPFSEAIIGYVREQEVEAFVNSARTGQSVNCDAVLGKLWRLRIRAIRSAASLGGLFR